MTPLLPDDLLDRATSLPLKPDPVTLQGRYITLIPTDVERDAAALFAVCNGQAATLGERHVPAYDADAQVWRWMAAGPFATLDDFSLYLHKRVAQNDELAFTMRDAATGQPIGMTSLMSNVPQFLRIEIGGIWVSPVAQGTLANTEASYLLLRHAFGLGYQRLEWKCNALNERSRRAALRLGFTFEGIMESHMIIKNRTRDTAWFRILAKEWDSVGAELERRLYGSEAGTASDRQSGLKI